MSYRADKLVIDTHTHEHTDSGDDNTRRPKLASGKNARHLGNIVTSQLKDDMDIQLKHGQFYGSVNSLFAKFWGIPQDINVASKLFYSYGCYFYGCQLCDLSSNYIIFMLPGRKQSDAYLIYHTIPTDTCHLLLSNHHTYKSIL